MTTTTNGIPQRINAGQSLKRLKELAGQAGANLYERVQLATGLLDNVQWIEAKFRGDQAAAAEKLEDDFFADISGLTSVFRLSDVFRMFPGEEKWKENRYNLKVMLGLWRKKIEEGKKTAQAQTEPDKSKRRNGVHNGDVIAEKDRAIEEKAAIIKRQEHVLLTKDETITRLQKENYDLRLQVAELKGRLCELERRERVGAA